MKTVKKFCEPSIPDLKTQNCLAPPLWRREIGGDLWAIFMFGER
ncbi:MAG: hypothetical protein AB4038_03010 [Prochloraceae cyanobacterium]